MLLPSHAATRGRSIALAVSVTALFLLGGCAFGPRIVTPEPPPIPEGGDVVPEQNEIVLTDGTQLVANAPWGRIKIEAGPGLRRVYTWRNNRRGVILEPRDQRFAGSMGIHYEGKPPVWAPAEGITKVDLEEGQRRFETIDDAMIWMQIRRLRYSYTNDGLVVGWKPKGDTLVVELWQFYIDGKKPTRLPGAEDSRLALGPLQVVPQKMKPQLLFADGHSEPYTPATTATASSSKGDDKSDSAAKTASSSQASNCSWFKNLFGQCDAAETVAESGASAADTTANAEAAASAAAGAAAANAAANNAESSDAQADEAEDAAPRASISAKLVNVRSGPGTDHKIVRTAKGGDTVAIRKEDSGWSYVEFDEGQTRQGWISNSLLEQD